MHEFIFIKNFIFLIPTGKYNYACFDSKKKVEFFEYKDVRKKMLLYLFIR